MSPDCEITEWKRHPIFSNADENGYVITKHGGRIGAEISPANISSGAIIRGNSLLEGQQSCVGKGSLIEDSYCKDAVIEQKSVVRDSVLLTIGKAKSHKCDSTGRYMARGSDVRVGPDVTIEHCHVTDTQIAADTFLKSSTLHSCDIGEANRIVTAKVALVHSERQVSIDGPTEVSEAWLGRNTRIDRQGYFEGVFSDEFLLLEYDDRSGQLCVKDIINIPHVSRYGTNVVNSTNSGRLLPQPGGVMKNFGPPIGLWHDPLLSHEPVLLGPCCWVCPWTKLIGKSAQVYQSPVEGVADRLHTCLMPFSVAGFAGDSSFGLVMPGEKSTGYGNNQRSGAWVFTHCPDAVVHMVRRLYEALGDAERHKADTVVAASLQNALAILKYQARQLNVDLERPREELRGSRAKWFLDTRKLLEVHIESGIWVFKDGEPVGWTQGNGKWHHAKLDEIRSMGLSRDGAFDISEAQLLTEPTEKAFQKIHLENALQPDDLVESRVTAGSVDASAQIHPTALIDPGARIGPNVTVGAGAHIGPGTLLKGESVVGAGSRLIRAVIENTAIGGNVRISRCVVTGSGEQRCVIGSEVKLTGCKIMSSKIGDRSTGVDAKVVNSNLAADTTIDMFATVENVRATKPMIVGGAMIDCRIDTALMNMHSPGHVSGLVAQPVTVEVNGEEVKIPAIVMLGGGCQIHGRDRESEAVVMEGAFVGSNAIIEAGTFVGLGSLVLGQLGPDEGLLPFAISVQQGPQTDEIGAVLTKCANLVITHIVGWTYQALPKEQTADVVHLIRGAINEGVEAIQYELDRRERGLAWGTSEHFTKYKSLPSYTEEQLTKGLRIYRQSLEQGCWDLVFDGRSLSFANVKGFWAEKRGHVCWHTRKAH